MKTSTEFYGIDGSNLNNLIEKHLNLKTYKEIWQNIYLWHILSNGMECNKKLFTSVSDSMMCSWEANVL
jgi:hypothetical protein